MGGSVANSSSERTTGHEEQWRNFLRRDFASRKKLPTSLWCYFGRAQRQAVAAEQLGGGWKGTKCELDSGEGKVVERTCLFVCCPLVDALLNNCATVKDL